VHCGWYSLKNGSMRNFGFPEVWLFGGLLVCSAGNLTVSTVFPIPTGWQTRKLGSCSWDEKSRCVESKRFRKQDTPLRTGGNFDSSPLLHSVRGSSVWSERRTPPPPPLSTVTPLPGCYSTIVGGEAGQRVVMRSPCRGPRYGP
jgi:hypothetical protein